MPRGLVMQSPHLLLLFFALALPLVGCDDLSADDDSTPGENADAPLNSVALIISDMEEPHEGRPSGVPDSYGWAAEPRVGMGNDPGDFRAFIAWGQIYNDAEGNPAENARVELQNMKAYVFSKQDQAWHPLQEAGRIEGAAYVEDFVDDVNKPADVRYGENDSTVAVKLESGYNYHFWPAGGRAPIDPDDIGGIFTTIQARLILDDPDGSDDREEARLLLSMGADYWLSLDAEWDQWTTNGDVGIGRFKYVTEEWRPFNMTSASPELLRANPPPLE